DPSTHTYTILHSATVLDGGKIINPQTALGQMRGGMYLGLSWASRETLLFNEKGQVVNNQLRTYDVLRLSEAPKYSVEFVETPLLDGPYGARGIGEYGVIGMAAALATSLSRASGSQMNELPITPELLWKKTRGEKHDSI